MKRVLFAGLVITALLLSLAGTVAAAPPADNPGNGPPDLTKVVFIHYRHDAAPAKGGIPGPPEGEYKYNGIHWADEDIPVDYWVNLTNSPVADADALTGINTGFQTWEDEPNSYMDWGFLGTSTDLSPQVIGPTEPDYNNVMGWEYLSDEYGANVIAVAVYWYNGRTKELVDVDVAMNSDPSYAWWQNPTGEDWVTGGEELFDEDGNRLPPYDVDIQNIMTHESGHGLVLGDLYADYNSEKTMYGYSAELELKKRSLDPGDETGIQAIYPITEEALTGTITGTVTDAATGDPIGGATVTADGYTTMTASDGTYTLADMPVGSYTVTASATGYSDQSKAADVLENQTTVVDFALSPAVAPTGTMHVADIAMSLGTKTAGPNTFYWAIATVTVIDAGGLPVEGATVEGHWEGATTDTDAELTGANGIASLTSDSVKNPASGAIFHFYIDNIKKDSWTYDLGSNIESDDWIAVP